MAEANRFDISNSQSSVTTSKLPELQWSAVIFKHKGNMDWRRVWCNQVVKPVGIIVLFCFPVVFFLNGPMKE